MLNIVIGPPCAGKTTFVKDHADDDAIRVDYDAIMYAISACEEHAEHIPEGVTKAAFTAREALINFACRNVDTYDTWIIHSFPSIEDMARYEELSATFHTIDPGKDVCLERAEKDGRPQRSIGGIEKWYSQHEETKAKEHSVHTKSFDTKVKATAASDDVGEVTMIVSVFDNVDSYGDVIRKGAFAETLKKWEEKGDPIPFIWSHRWDDPMSHIGVVKTAVETDKGLQITAEIDLDSETSRKVYKLLKGRRITQASIGYSVDNYETSEKDGERITEITALTLYECGPCLVGVNPATELLTVKAEEIGRYIKAGHVLSESELESMRRAFDSLGAILGEETPASDSGEQTSGDTPAEEETTITSQSEAASEESPASHSRSAQVLARLALSILED